MDIGKDEITRWHLVNWEEMLASLDPTGTDGPTPTRPARLWEVLCGYAGS